MAESERLAANSAACLAVNTASFLVSVRSHLKPWDKVLRRARVVAAISVVAPAAAAVVAASVGADVGADADAAVI